MKRIFGWNFGCLVLLAGCAGGGGGSTKKSSVAKPLSSLPVTAVARDGTTTEAVTRLRINSETVEAEALWRGAWKDLIAKSQALPPTEFRKYVDEWATARINDHIAESLLYQQATLREPIENEKVLDRFIDEQVRKNVTEDFGGVQRRYEKYLESQGQTLEDVRDAIRRELVIAKYLETELRPKVDEPTRADLYEAYQSAIELMRKQPRRSMSLIEVRVLDRLPKEVTQPTREQQAEARRAARQRVEAAESELRSGKSFAEVARTYSDGLRAAEGGAWGRVTREGVRERFLPAIEALEQLSEGGVSPIIETEDGFYLVRCDEFQPGFEPDFESVQPELHERYVRATFNRLIADRVRELRLKARFDPENISPFHLGVAEAGLKIAGSKSGG